ncbi:MAG: hypothetical protein Kow0090_12230 [Myxococcota bacterium]
MRSCDEIIKLFDERRDKTLPLMTRVELRIHFLFCKHCRKYYEDMEKMLSLLSIKYTAEKK